MESRFIDRFSCFHVQLSNRNCTNAISVLDKGCISMNIQMSR